MDTPFKTIANEYFVKSLLNVYHYGTYDKNPRPKWKDGTPAFSKFICQSFESYDLSVGHFPIQTFRHTPIKTGIKEILWIYKDQSNDLDQARQSGVTWWDEWDIGDGTIGQRYGATVKRYDMINRLINNIKNDPYSRRHIMNLYQETDLKESNGLYPCAYETLWSVRDDKLDMTLIQRSSDFLIANTINKIQYVALQMIIAKVCGLELGTFCHLVHNLHVYDRHLDIAKTIYIDRYNAGLYKEVLGVQPRIILTKDSKDFYAYCIDDFIIDWGGIVADKTPLEIAV